jgi:hypothetical protein
MIMSLPTPNVNRPVLGGVLVPLFGGLELLVLILGSKN